MKTQYREDIDNRLATVRSSGNVNITTPTNNYEYENHGTGCHSQNIFIQFVLRKMSNLQWKYFVNEVYKVEMMKQDCSPAD